MMRARSRHTPAAARVLPVLLASVSLGLGASGCGGTARTVGSLPRASSTASTASEPLTTVTVTSVISPGQRVRGDGDADNPSDIDGNGDIDSAATGGQDADNDNPTRASYSFPDGDDKATFAYGRPPSPSVGRAIVSIVRDYYAAGAAGDGARACALLTPNLARSTPEDYGRAGGPSYLRGGKTCQMVMSMLFAHFHSELTEAITVVEVRVAGGTAQVVFSSRKMPASDIFLRRRGNTWRMVALLGRPLP